MRDPFYNLQPLKYNFIMADPPWQFELFSEKGEQKSAQAHYQCSSLEDIKALPVSHLASGDCLLMLWATWPMLREAIAVMEAWGFTYKTGGDWHKITRNGKQHFGTGYVLRNASEPFLIGTLGNPVTSKSCRTSIPGVVREHSRKPEEAFAWAEKLMPTAWRLELFSRQQREGWDCWGDEVNKFDKEMA